MNSKKYLYFSKTIIMIFLFVMAYIKENTYGIRAAAFIGLFTLLLLGQYMRNKRVIKGKIYLCSFFVDTLFIFALESMSKYVINNYLHLFYIIMILEAGLALDRKRGLWVNISIAGISLIKYLYKFDNEFMFQLLILCFIMVTLNYAKAQKEAAAKIEDLSKANERLRIGREIHDSLGHTLTGLIMQLEMAYYVFDTQRDNSYQLLHDSIGSSRKALQQTRQAVEKLRDDKYDIMEMIKQFQDQTMVNIIFNDDADSSLFKEQYKGLIFRFIQEALTNSMKHGKAENISINIVREKGYIAIKVEDDGMGTERVVEGYGLKGMRERLDGFDGSFEYGNKNKGFYIKALVPAGDVYE